jgi:3-polyprenyl-4-hydroxybenzoate decarboxylase
MKIHHIDEGVGRIVKGVNTTADVGVDQTRIEAAKFGNKVDKDGRPPTLSKKVKGKSTNVLFNLGMAESKEPRYTAYEWALMEGGHTLEDIEPETKEPGRIFTALEKFADGKKKGKSRPGRVKRSGASCKGSVTDLRKRAKKYSGERGRMYHWCANMKGGKKK